MREKYVILDIDAMVWSGARGNIAITTI